MSQEAASADRLAGKQPEAVTAADWLDFDEALFKTRPRAKSDSVYTYVIAASGQGIKIGHSKGPKGRLSSMQTGSPLNMWLVHTWRLSEAGAKHLERQLHAAFRWASIHGEWFSAYSQEIIAVGDLFVASRTEDARRLTDLVQKRRQLEQRVKDLEAAWYRTSGTRPERAAAEKAATALVPAARREVAINMLEAYELGLWIGRPPHTRWGKVELEALREQAK